MVEFAEILVTLVTNRVISYKIYFFSTSSRIVQKLVTLHTDSVYESRVVENRLISEDQEPKVK